MPMKKNLEARETQMRAIRIVISCNSLLFCEGMASVLQKEDDFEIIGKIEDEPQALKSITLAPDVFILDPLLFGPDELPNIIHELKTRASRSKILLLIEKEMSDNSLIQCMMRGVDGYVRRSAKLTQIAEAIRTVYAGNIWAERKLLEKFVRYAPVLTSNLETQLSKLDPPLTKREKEVISSLLLGLPNKRISRTLHISEKTVKTHLNNIFKKMKVSNRTQVVSTLMHAR
jgi:DNA-binding NarL/FixJ family response regulator